MCGGRACGHKSIIDASAKELIENQHRNNNSDPNISVRSLLFHLCLIFRIPMWNTCQPPPKSQSTASHINPCAHTIFQVAHEPIVSFRIFIFPLSNAESGNNYIWHGITLTSARSEWVSECTRELKKRVQLAWLQQIASVRIHHSSVQHISFMRPKKAFHSRLKPSLTIVKGLWIFFLPFFQFWLFLIKMRLL